MPFERVSYVDHPFKPGDRVAYSREFLRNTGQFTGEAPFKRGTVISVHDHRSYGPLLVHLRWDGTTLGCNVNASNLVHADRLHLEDR
jgi:hypothetical protein